MVEHPIKSVTLYCPVTLTFHCFGVYRQRNRLQKILFDFIVTLYSGQTQKWRVALSQTSEMELSVHFVLFPGNEV